MIAEGDERPDAYSPELRAIIPLLGVGYDVHLTPEVALELYRILTYYPARRGDE